MPDLASNGVTAELLERRPRKTRLSKEGWSKVQFLAMLGPPFLGMAVYVLLDPASHDLASIGTALFILCLLVIPLHFYKIYRKKKRILEWGAAVVGQVEQVGRARYTQYGKTHWDVRYAFVTPNGERISADRKFEKGLHTEYYGVREPTAGQPVQILYLEERPSKFLVYPDGTVELGGPE